MTMPPRKRVSPRDPSRSTPSPIRLAATATAKATVGTKPQMAGPMAAVTGAMDTMDRDERRSCSLSHDLPTSKRETGFFLVLSLLTFEYAVSEVESYLLQGLVSPCIGREKLRPFCFRLSLQRK